jgi:hypothetical protein
VPDGEELLHALREDASRSLARVDEVVVDAVFDLGARVRPPTARRRDGYHG